MPLTFGDTDPFYRHRQLDKLGQGLGLFMQIRQQKEAERDRERQAALSRFFELAQKMPEVAAQAGPQLVQKYGKDIPELQGMVDWLQNQGQVRQKMESAGRRYLTLADQLAQRNQARQATPQQGAVAGISPLANAPQLAQTPSAATAPGQPAGDLAFVEAARSLPPSQRQMAEVWAKSEGLPFPERFQPSPFDPYEDLTQKGRGVLAAETGELPPETSTAQRIQAGLAESAGQKLQRELQEESASRQKELAYLRDARTAAGQAIQRRKVDVQERREERLAKGGSEEIKPRELAKEIKESLLGSSRMMTPGKDEKGEAVQVGEDRVVRKPLFQPFTPTQAQALAGAITRQAVSRAKAAGEDPADLAFRATSAAFDLYTDLVIQGVQPRDAIQIVLGKKEPPKDFYAPESP